MAKYDFFISYSSKDEKIAFKIVNAIESTGHTCWIAPRNIPYGTPYARAIMEGISECSTFLVLISDSSIKSENVLNEVDNAHALNKKIIPVRLTEIQLPRELNFYLSRTQWMTLPSNSPESIISLLDLGEDPTKADEKITRPEGKNKINMPFLIIAALVVILGIGGVIWWHNNSKQEETAENVLAEEEFPTPVKLSENDSISNQKDTITQILPKNQAASTAPTITQPPAPNIKEAQTSSKDKNYKDMIIKANKYYADHNYKEAFPLYVDIANNYDANYAHQVGWMYQYGQGTSPDPVKAVEWYKKIADYHSGARSNLIDLYQKLAKLCMSESNYKDEAHWYEELGALYMREKNYKEATHWYELGNDTGYLHPNCKYWLGYLYYHALGGVDKNLTKAKEYWQQAASEGNENAKSDLNKYFKE